VKRRDFLQKTTSIGLGVGALSGIITISCGQSSSSCDKSSPPRGYSIPLVDLSGESDRWVIVDRKAGKYLGQPDTVLLSDGHTILCGYPRGHGGPDTLLKRSRDGGFSWSDRLPVPESFSGDHNAPTLHRLIDVQGKERLVLFVSYPVMKRAISEDNGNTWSHLKPIYDEELKGKFGYKGHAPPKSVVSISGNRYMALHHDHQPLSQKDKTEIAPVKIYTNDGGVNWSKPEKVGIHPKYPGAHPCEPALIRSPDGSQLLCLMRENSRQYNSLMMTSDDEGTTWSEMRELPGSLTGDRHIARYAPDGRIVVTFRDMTHKTPTRGDFVGWVGTYEDIINGWEGQYRLRLLDNKGNPGDTGYAGLEVLADGTFVSTTYCVMEKGEQPLVVSLRFTIDDIDKIARA
jgi:hypothetical protein